MSSIKKIIRNPIQREIERIKTKLSKEYWGLSWSDYRKILDEEMKKFYGSSWRDKLISPASLTNSRE